MYIELSILKPLDMLKQISDNYNKRISHYNAYMANQPEMIQAKLSGASALSLDESLFYPKLFL